MSISKSDEAQWFRMAEGETELLNGIVPRKKRRINPAQLKYIVGTLGIGERRLAEFVPDYGNVISEKYRVKLITLADARASLMCR